MPYSIGLAGKGGTGKTTIAGLMIKYMVENNLKPILAVDADPNSNFNEVLGLKFSDTLGEAREEMKKGVSTGMTKDVFMKMKLEQAVVEAEGFDLIVMGRPEGPGCYCAANTLLTQYLDKLIKNYQYIVVDNEAGMEHISRLTTNNIDLLLIVADPTRRSIQAGARIKELTEELGVRIQKIAFIVNQVKKDQIKEVEKAGADFKLHFNGFIPEDPQIQHFDLIGKPIISLEKDSEALKAAYHIFADLFMD